MKSSSGKILRSPPGGSPINQVVKKNARQMMEFSDPTKGGKNSQDFFRITYHLQITPIVHQYTVF